MLALLVLALVWLPQGKSVREDDVLYLKSGDTATGQLVYEDDTRIVLRNGSRETEYAPADVTEVDARTRTLDALLERLAAAQPFPQTPTDVLLELAAVAAAGRLSGEAQLLYLRVLLSDPAHGAAVEALGGRARGTSATVRLDGTTYSMDDLSRPAGKWRDRWNLSTMHYEVATNLPLDQAIAAAFDLERFFDAFYDLFARELQLHEPSERMAVQIHADDVSYPEPSDGRRASFDAADRIVHVNASRGGWEPAMVHDLVLQICHQTTARSPSGRGNVPRWLASGLGESLATGLGGMPGQLRFDLASPSLPHLRRHAEAEKPFELSRVLAFGDEDFGAGTDLDLKYAQSYTLVQFSLYGDEGRHNQGFMDFMRSAWLGRSSVSQFETDLGIGRKSAFEEAWLTWVRAAARRP